jgi:hypothetical protein
MCLGSLQLGSLHRIGDSDVRGEFGGTTSDGEDLCSCDGLRDWMA